ncbi:MAG: hypothetical protein E7299_04950 [Lachnospiraceae bacterium]|nr:hypothetical protein [Lachnospiraceae bacterium]
MSETVGNNGAKMKEINIYLYSTIKGGKEKNGAYTYILETATSKGNATITKTEKVEDMTANKSVLCALIAAMKRIRQSSYLVIYTDCHYLVANTRDSLGKWSRNGWKTARGDEIKNPEQWKEIHQLLMPHSFEFIVGTSHSYYQWMKKETEAAAECM